MFESMPTPKSNLSIVELPNRVPVTERVGREPAKPVLIIRRGGRAFRQCRVCGKLSRVAPGDSQ